MNKLLIYLGLLSPFVLKFGYDTREPKMVFVLLIAFSVSLITIFKGQLKRFDNKWLFILLTYLLINTIKLPSKYIIGEQVYYSIWMWKPLLYCFVFSLFIVSVASIKFTRKELKRITDIMIWVTLIISIYMIFQWLRIEQFFFIKKGAYSTYRQIRTIGTFGWNTMASSFLAIVFPLALVYDWKKSLVILLAILLTQSQIAIGAVIVSSLYLSIIRKKYWASVIVFILLVIALFHLDDSGRIGYWIKAIADIKQSPYTGWGLGSYSILFPAVHDNKFMIAHNEYLEFTYNTGLIGIGLLITCIVQLLNKVKTIHKQYLLGAFISVACCAFGNYVWQLGAHIFYTCVIVGLICNETNERI